MRKVMLLVWALLGVATAAQAQSTTPKVIVAPYVGAVLDTPDDWFLFGGEARLPIKINERPFEFNPRITFNPFEGGSVTQFDFNLLHHYAVDPASKFKPYVGAGLAISRLSFDDFSDTSAGLNLLTGV